MIKEICNDIKTKLIEGGFLSLIDVYAGLVQTVTYKIPDENGNLIVKRMPVSYDTTMAVECSNAGKERAVVPDSSKKGILYFEDNGGVLVNRQLSGGRAMYTGNLVLVCWMNKKRTVGDTYAEISKAAYDQITEKLQGKINSQYFINLRAVPVKFRQDAAIFGKYTYDETVLQYLRPPFEYLAIDLKVTFIAKCGINLPMNPQECETIPTSNNL